MPPRERTLTPDEVRQLLPQLLPHRQLWLLVALYTGGRQLEVERLTWERIDWDAGLLWLDGTKTRGSKRLLPFAAGLRSLLEQVPEEERSGPVVGLWSCAWRDLTAACDRAGVERCNLLDLRRSCASWLADNGATETQVAKILGHTKTGLAAKVYIKHAAQALQEKADTLPEMKPVEPAPVFGRAGYKGPRKRTMVEKPPPKAPQASPGKPRKGSK